MEEIFAAKKTSIRMMLDRGYKISQEEMTLLDVDQHPAVSSYNPDRIQFLHSLGSTYFHSLLNEITVIRFASYLEGDGQSVSAKTIKQYSPEISALRSSNPGYRVYYILIGDTPITSNISKAMSDVDSHDWQYFGLDDLQSSPVTHVMQPSSYTKMGQDEAISKMKELKVTNQGLCWMLETDPVARWYWYKPGDLILAVRDYEFIEAFSPMRPNYLLVVRSPSK